MGISLVYTSVCTSVGVSPGYTSGCTSVGVYLPGLYLRVYHGAHASLCVPTRLFPFHCWWMIPIRLLFPFHCWVILPPPCAYSLPVSMLVLTSCSHLFPFHCWSRVAPSCHHPFHCWSYPGPWRLVPNKPQHSHIPATYETSLLDILRNVRNVEQAGGRNGSRINPEIKGNRRDKLKKPATESTSAQGKSECEEVSFPAQNCKCHCFARFSHSGTVPPV